MTKTTFDKLLDEAVQTKKELDAMEGLTASKLTGPAFFREALALAGVPADVLDAIAPDAMHPAGGKHPLLAQLKDLAEAIDSGRAIHAAAACRNVMRVISGGTGMTVRRPFASIGGYIGDEGRNELTALGVAPVLLMAEAVRRLYYDSPCSFGTCRDADEHGHQINVVRERLEMLERKLESSWTGADLVIDTDGLSTDERRRGLMRVTFKAAPTVAVGAGSGRELVQAMARA